MAQITFTSQVPLGISSAKDVLFIGGNLDNQSTSSLLNNGKLVVTANVNNEQANMQAGSGTLVLQGNAEQIITGTKIFNTYNLNTNNEGGILLNNNLSISNVHVFTNGIITTENTPNVLIYKSNATYTGDGDNRHVKGTVKKYGSADFDFPVGNGTIERKAGLKNITESSVFSCTYQQNTPKAKSVENIDATNEKEFWSIKQSDKFHAAANVILSWNQNKVVFDSKNKKANAVKVSQMVNDKWNDASGKNSGKMSISGNVASEAVSNFGDFSLGFVSKAESTEVEQKAIKNYLSKRVDKKTYQISFAIDHENGEGTYEISYKNANGTKVSLTELLANADVSSVYTTNVTLTDEVLNPEFSIHELGRLGTKHLADIINTETESTPDDELITVVGNGSEPMLKIKSMIDENTTYTLEIYNTAGQLVSATNNIEVSANSEQIVPVDLPLIERGMFMAVLVSNRKKKKSIKIAH
jgi:hypothetical protein